MCGGRINTDFIDNSAGVDTSDHEVNIKILLRQRRWRHGRLSLAERDELLASMTDEVAELVLAHNYDQNLALANAVHGAASMAHVHEDWMARLEDRGLLDREIEFLPSTEAMEARQDQPQGARPRRSWPPCSPTPRSCWPRRCKASDLPDDPYLADRLVDYFPSRAAGALRRPDGRAPAAPGDHRHRRGQPVRQLLRDQLLPPAVRRDRRRCTGRHPGPDRRPGDLRGRRARCAASGRWTTRSTPQVQTGLRMEVRTLVERATRWLVNNRRRPIDIGAAVAQLAAGVQAVQAALPTLLTGRDAEALTQRLKGYRAAKVPEDLALAVAALPPGVRGADHRADRGPGAAWTWARWPRCTSRSASGSAWTGCSPGSSSCRGTTAGRPWPAPPCATTCTPCTRC